MNEQLIKFIELCLMDGVVTDKEREVIFRKSKEFGVPEDECEIILDSMVHSFNKEDDQTHPKHQEETKKNTTDNLPKKELKTIKNPFKNVIRDLKLNAKVTNQNVIESENKIHEDIIVVRAFKPIYL